MAEGLPRLLPVESTPHDKVVIPLDAGAVAGTSGGQRLLDGREGNGWPVRVNQRRLFRTIHGVAAQGSGRLMLNIAQDLEFAADMDIEALAYARTPAGFLTGMNTLAPTGADGGRGSSSIQPATANESAGSGSSTRPRASGASPSAASTTTATSRQRATSPDLACRAATSITAQQLEAGASHFNGRFGDGRGKWRLFIEANRNVQAMSLVESPTGHLHQPIVGNGGAR